MIRIGVIGVGNISRSVHIPSLAKLPDVLISAVCDTNPDLLTQCAEKYNINKSNRFTDYSELINSSDVDAVTIVTPNNTHVDIAMEAIRAKKSFCVEKPLGINCCETQKLIDFHKKNPVPDMVCFSYRFKSAARYAKHLIQSGSLGKIFHVYIQYFQSWGNSDCPRVWRFSKKEAGSGSLADLGSHMIDMARFLTGEEYVSITADNGTIKDKRKAVPSSYDGETAPVDVDDYSHFCAKMTGGISAVFNITRFAWGYANYQRIEVYGERGGLIYGHTADDVPATLDIFSEGKYQRAEIPLEFESDQMETFVFVTKGGERNGSADIYDGHTAQIILDAVIESDETGKRIDLI